MKASEAKRQSKIVADRKENLVRRQRQRERDKDEQWAKDNFKDYLNKLELEIKKNIKKGYTSAQIDVPYNDAGTSLAWKLISHFEKDGYRGNLVRQRNTEWFDDSYVTISWGD